MKSISPAAWFVLAFSGVAGASLGAGQGPQTADPQTPIFRSQVEYVEVDAVVTDSTGAFVRDLTPEEFRVFEDGKPQTVTTFSIVDIPVEPYDKPLFARQPIEPDVTSNERPFDGRVYMVVMDELHTDFTRTVRAQTAARRFITNHMGANDLMAVIHTGAPTEANQEFTNKKRLLLAAVDKSMGQQIPSPGDPERLALARRSLDTLKEISEWLAGVRGRRKTILFFSEGLDAEVGNTFASFGGSTLLDTLRETIASAARSHVSIFCLDPRGLAQSTDDSISVVGVEDMSRGIGAMRMGRDVMVAHDSLRELSEETGGFAVVGTNNLAASFERIVRDNSTYYVLAYYPPADKPGKVHEIDVRVTRPGLQVRARKAYVTPSAETSRQKPDPQMSPQLRTAFGSPIPVSGLTMRAFAAPFRGAAPNASVLLGIEIRGSDLALGENDKLVLSYVAVDAQGKPRGASTQTVTLNLAPASRLIVNGTGVRLLNRLDLPPGRYQVRVGAQDLGLGTVGSLSYNLDVPDFTKGNLVMSGVVFTSPSSALEPTVRADEQLAQILPGPPSGFRTFGKDEEMAIFAEVYDNQASKAHKVEIVATVTTDEGRVLFKTTEERDSSELKGKRGGYGYATRIPFKDLEPGPYVLTVSARSTLGDGSRVERQVQFTVEGRR